MGGDDPLGRFHAVPGLTGEERAAITDGTAARLLGLRCASHPTDWPTRRELPMTTDHPFGTAVATTVEVSGGFYAYVQPDGGWVLNDNGFLVGHRGLHRHRHLADPGAGRRSS